MLTVSTPLVSVVIPTYGRNDALIATIECVQKQSYQNWEIIIVDDNSATSEQRQKNQLFFEGYQADNRLRYLQHEDNAGACAARNTGVKNAKGEIIAFYDDDDIWYDTKLEKQVAFLLEHQLDYTFCWMNEHYQGYRKLIDFDGEPGLYEALLKKGDGICTSAIMVTRSAALSQPFDVELESFQDFDYLLRLARHYKGAVQKEVLMDYQISPLGISRNPRKKVQGLQRIIEKFAEQYRAIGYTKGLAELHQKQADFMLLMGLYWPSLGHYMKSITIHPLCVKSWIKLFAGALTGKLVLTTVIGRKQKLQWQKLQTK